MAYLVLNREIQKKSFLSSQLGIEDFSRLYIGKQTYVEQLLQDLPFWQGLEILFSDGPIKNFIQLKTFLELRGIDYRKVDQNLNIYFYDLNLCPRDADKLNNIFQKAAYSEDLVIFNNGKEVLPILKLRANDLKNHHDQGQDFSGLDIAKLEIEMKDSFISMDNTNDVLELFSNNFQARYFNHISDQNSYFLKSSSNTSKISAEYKFLTNIPTPLKSCYPQVGELKMEEGRASYQIEKIYMFDLSKQLINKVLSQRKNVKNVLKRIRDYFQECPRQLVSNEKFREAINKSIIQKNNQRFAELRNLDIFEAFNQVAIMLGYKSCQDVHEQILTGVEDFILESKDTDLIFSHGDLCFSNILFDPHTQSLKLIDPRGFQEDVHETYRPIYYDLAKLSHSFLGLYDLIVYDLLDIKFNEDAKIELKYLLEPDYLSLLKEEFFGFIKELGYNIGEIRLFEASLFISMIPLHRDGKKKMLAQFIQAIKSLEAYKKLCKKKKYAS